MTVETFLARLEEDEYVGWIICRNHLVKHGALPHNAVPGDAEDWAYENLEYEGCEGCPHNADCPLR